MTIVDPDFTGVIWITSTRSEFNGQCVEVAFVAGGVGVRDSKDRGGPALAVSRAAWVGFLRAVSDHDLPA